MSVTRSRSWPIGGPVLVEVANSSFADLANARAFIREIPALGLIAAGRRHPTVEREARAFSNWGGRDDVAALIGPATGPFTQALLENADELSAERIEAARGQAEAIVRALIEISEKTDTVPRPRLKQHPTLAPVLGRTLPHRFVAPLHLPVTREDQKRDRPPETVAPGLGQWHAVIASMDDLLTWATADVLRTNTAAHFGSCDGCGRVYFAKRARNHRFCPESDCRDRYWNKETGKARVEKSREKRKRT